MYTLACFVLVGLIVLAWMVSVCIAMRHRDSPMLDAERQEHMGEELRDSNTYEYYLR
jgi:hypothetical protein